MKKKTIAVLASSAIALAISLPAFAAKNKDAGHAFIGAGLTAGGKDLPAVESPSGDLYTIKSGGLAALYLGYEYRFGFGMTLQGNIGYHYNKTKSSDGGLSFRRYPAEMLAFFDLSERFRMGGGLRYVMNPWLSGNGFASSTDRKFDNALGVVVEAEYFYLPSASVKVRAVSEKYKLQGTSSSTNGTHGGVYASYYF